MAFESHRIRFNNRVSKAPSNGKNSASLAAMVGFEDQSYFTKVFKKIVGVSPGKYRENRGNVNYKKE